MILDGGKHIADERCGIADSGRFDQRAQHLLLTPDSSEIPIGASPEAGIAECLESIKRANARIELGSENPERLRDLDFDPTEGIDEGDDPVEIDQRIVVDVDSQEVLDHQLLIRNPANRQCVIDLGHAVAREIDPAIARDVEQAAASRFGVEVRYGKHIRVDPDIDGIAVARVDSHQQDVDWLQVDGAIGRRASTLGQAGNLVCAVNQGRDHAAVVVVAASGGFDLGTGDGGIDQGRGHRGCVGFHDRGCRHLRRGLLLRLWR